MASTQKKLKNNKTLKQLLKQNKERLKEYCSSKYFKKIVTLEEALTTVLQFDEIKNALKTMTVASKETAINNRNGEIRLILTFSNDDCAKADIELMEKLKKLIL